MKTKIKFFIVILSIMTFIPHIDAQAGTPCDAIPGVIDPRLQNIFIDTYVNTLDVTASDVCVQYVGTGGSLSDLIVIDNPPACPIPAAAHAGSNIVWIDWGTPCVAPGNSVTVLFEGDPPFIIRSLVIWTLNHTAIPNQTEIPPVKITPNITVPQYTNATTKGGNSLDWFGIMTLTIFLLIIGIYILRKR